MDVLCLSRLQFALTIMFHYLFPPLTIGLGVMLVVLEGLYLKTRDPQYEAATRFWIMWVSSGKVKMWMPLSRR